MAMALSEILVSVFGKKKNCQYIQKVFILFSWINFLPLCFKENDR